MILHGDCRQQLATLPDASVDAIVTDPPYELGFMGKKWDASGIAYDPEVWSQCLRVLKPGGHLLAFGGTRTYHRMTCAIEDAGFEIRDSLHWIYGSGFPKSLDVSKAIDKAAGAERTVIGVVPWDNSVNHFVPGEDHTQRVQRNVTAPATPAAAAAAGWGTALKPAHEPIVLARKPLAGTVAANVMEYGTGALNIDATRVGTDTITTQHTQRPAGDAVVGRGATSSGATSTHNGRWPANIILTHSPECEQVGTTERAGGAGTRCTNRAPDGKCLGHDNAGRSTSGQTVHGPDTGTGTETVAVWNCVAGCPVATLNEQSGDLHPPGTRSKRPDRGPFSTGVAPLERDAHVIKDRGGASRYFTTTEWDPELDVPFLYVAKPSRAERNAGLDGMPERSAAERYETLHTLNADNQQRLPAANFHPTVKPVALIRHLIRLITPPGGTVLDPFLGSGTTAVAAILEGFNWIGCELTDDYLPIIEARVAHARTIPIQQDLFE